MSSGAVAAVQHPRPVLLPFLNTSFAFDLQAFLSLWLLWWVVGAEQLLVAPFVLWCAVRYLPTSARSIAVPGVVRWAGALAAWWLVSAAWVSRDMLDIFVKEAATAWAQVFILWLFWNGVRSARDWWQVFHGLEALAAFVGIGAVIYASGLWRGEFLSLTGQFLPPRLVEGSDFFGGIAVRTFGSMDIVSSALPRTSSAALKYSGLSLVTVVLVPLLAWSYAFGRPTRRLWRGVILLGLVTGLVFAQSRVAYLALGSALGLGALLVLRWFRPGRRLALLSALLVGMVAVAATAYFLVDAVIDSARTTIMDWRPGSALVRLRVYAETLRLLPEHAITGWGVPVRISGVSSRFSAGTHSSYLGMMFQHGIVGLALYVCLLVSLWRRIGSGLAAASRWGPVRGFWVAAAVSMLGFNIREAADVWWWDQLVTATIWTTWGLILTAERAFDGHRSVIASPAPHTPG